ncbi:hypothetical protein XCR1_970052 [Xenorhabdus cabanillasii JM26]|uniref:Uncharacterized protein n=1 Tax=Xenorhabdus cabanillasii JM26 TaxID=1427517 RepID=W1JCB4_9GAMM|nr:hypothetical protein XCR1_970052 [Xenorhabdus cabanillasii JM26]
MFNSSLQKALLIVVYICTEYKISREGNCSGSLQSKLFFIVNAMFIKISLFHTRYAGVCNEIMLGQSVVNKYFSAFLDLPIENIFL